ncbi:MAG: hypothetical protein B2I17_01965 [Thermoplasmatales archaeon B_DKE]|nr:MAG: hypothetical protein B2I17_01965 [Thermoplasmatales archaeon B_DKE]
MERVRKLVQIAITVTEDHGFPLFHRTYAGNISGRKIFTGMIATLVEMGLFAESRLEKRHKY